MFSFEQKNEQKSFLNSALNSKMGQIKKFRSVFVQMRIMKFAFEIY